MALTRPTAYQINTVSTTITDPLIVLNQGSTAANIDIGFILNRNPSANVAIVWQASSNQFIFANTSSSGTTNANITVSNYANLRAGNLIATSVTYANGQSILTNVESAITTANTNLKGYVDGQISTTGTSVTTANTNMKGYVDGQISTTTTTANTNLKGYTDNLVSTANVNLKGYVDAANTLQSSQISAANTAITTANTNMKGYVDGQISTTTTAITTANTNLKGYTDNLVTTANTNLKGYTDGQISTTTTAITTANTNLKGYTDNLVTTANTNLKGYVDAANTIQSNQVAGANSAITTANTNLKGYTDNLVTTANTNLKGYVDGTISNLINGAPSTLDTLNEIAVALGNDANLSVTLTNQISGVQGNVTGANAAIVTANTNMKGYVDGQISTTTTAITTANTNLKGYVDAANTIQSNQVAGANSAITTANTNMKGYVDGQISTTTTAITTANTNLKGYTDNLVTTANTNMKGYVDGQISTTTTAITTANTNLKGYTDGQISTRAALTGAIFSGAVNTTELFVTGRSGDEGGQLNLANAVTNTTLVGNIVIDVFQNRLRIFEGGGTARGGYFDISGLAASAGTNLAAGGGGTPGGSNSQIQFNNSSSFGGATSLYYFSGNGVVLANAAVASTSTTTGALQVSGGIGVAGNVWCGQVYSTNNGNGTNYRIGDDAWLGDVNIADTAQLMGAQNGNNGYLRFGNVGTETLGRAGSGALTWTGTFSATNINSDNHNYANGTSIITTLSTTITTANTNMKGYVDGQISTTTTAITTANTNMKGYVDSANTIQSTQITTVSSSVTGANAAIVTANTNMKGYVDGQISTTSSSITTANTNLKGYIDSANTIQSNQIAGANATMVTSVTGTAPVVSSGGKTPAISMAAATASVNGYMTSTYASKLDGIAAGATNVTNTNQLTNGNAFVTASVTLTTAAQTNITSVGTLTGLTTSGAITSTLATGTAPFTIASTTKVANLNVDLLDGLHADTAYNSFGAGTIPVRHSSGYLYSNYFNMTADQTTTAATRIAVETGTDSFLRWQTPAQFITNSKIVDWKNHTAQLTLSGGGTVTFNGTALLWSARVIAIPVENAEYSASGYIDITCPTSGTVVYYNAANATTTVTATAAGIPLAAWEAIYYQVTEGQTFTSDQTKFRVVNYTNSTWSPGPGWILIASRNGDDSTVRWLPGQKTIPSGGSYYTTSDTQSWAALTAKYADLAEKYVADKNYVPGTVVVFGGNKEITVSSASHDPAIAGVISTNPAYLMNYEVDGLALSVALQGRVPCRVQGPINKGDCVVSSDTPGVAQRLDRAQYLPGCVIGKALEDITEDRIVTIEVVVGRV